jgi:hypothetical protein
MATIESAAQTNVGLGVTADAAYSSDMFTRSSSMVGNRRNRHFMISSQALFNNYGAPQRPYFI